MSIKGSNIYKYKNNFVRFTSIIIPFILLTASFSTDLTDYSGNSENTSIIVDWSNNFTNDNVLQIIINPDNLVEFIVAYDQTGNITWFEDGNLSQTIENSDNSKYITKWNTSSFHKIGVNNTNRNGTSDIITWEVTVNDMPIDSNAMQDSNIPPESRMIDITISNNDGVETDNKLVIIALPEIPSHVSLLTDQSYSHVSEINNTQHKVHFKGQIEDSGSIEFDYRDYYVILQPLNIQSQKNKEKDKPIRISNKKGSLINDNDVVYNDVFGPNTKLSYQVGLNYLKETLIIEDPSALPLASDIDGEADLAFSGWMDYSPDLTIYLNGKEYQLGVEETSGRIEFRNDDETVFYFEEPVAYDASENQIELTYQIYREGGKIYWAILVPYSWLNEIDNQNIPVRSYPITIDPTISYNFTFTVADAWDYAGNSAPVPGNHSWTAATSPQKSAISALDGSRWSTQKTSGHDQTDYQLYRFRLNHSIPVVKLVANWTGYGESTTGYNTTLSIWNFTSSSYDLLRTQLLGSENTFNVEIVDPDDYINASRDIFLLTTAKHNDYAPILNTYSVSSGTISASATDQDLDTVEYYYEWGTTPSYGSNSGWITATSKNTLQGPPPCDTTYYYRVKARANSVETAYKTMTESGDYCSGSCPFVDVWNGEEFEHITDVYSVAIGSPKLNFQGKTNGYIDLENLVPKDGKYTIKLRESLTEADFFDYAKMLVLDVPEGYTAVSTWYSMSMGEGWHMEDGVKYVYPPEPGFDTVVEPKAPISVIDKYGQDMTSQLSIKDGVGGYETAEDINYYIIDFGKIEHPENAKLLISVWQATTAESL
ncbi:MAG: hypothetical protein E4G94_05045, partial [ANME-2 cluster archaeon]